MTDDQKKAFGDALGISEEDQRTLNSGSNHPYSCRCEACRQWWKLMGPDEDSHGNQVYGPFSEEEVKR